MNIDISMSMRRAAARHKPSHEALARRLYVLYLERVGHDMLRARKRVPKAGAATQGPIGGGSPQFRLPTLVGVVRRRPPSNP